MTRFGTCGAAATLTAMVACSAAPRAGFWFAPDSVVLPADATERLGGPLTSEEATSIKTLARGEVERAFSGLRITVTTSQHAFWRVEVLHNLPTIRNSQRAAAGESLAMGFLGGAGAVGFEMVATDAIRYAPPHALRQQVSEGIGRGIGRVAVHEFMHQMLGPAAAHNTIEVDSYEYGSPARPSQYYGQLHWTTAWPLLHQKFGR